ncbi:MAG: methyltransferase domain-containing protein [Patescibacteria group bacterium]
MPVSGGAQFLNPKEILGKLQITEGMTIADLGCGNLGYFIIPAAKLIGKEGKAYAVDIQKSVLDAVVSRAKLDSLTNIETIWSNLEDAGSTKIPSGTVDIAILVNILFQNKKKKEIIYEAARILRNGGKVIIIDWKKIGIPFGPPVELRVEPNVIKSWATELRLRLIEETEFGDYFWGLIFEKI